MTSGETTFQQLLHKANRHEVLPAELLGDTLVLSPAGDLTGYSRTLFSTEIQRIQQLVDAPEVRHVIIDLGMAPYFGSEMVGAFTMLRRRADPERGVVFSGPSSEMRLILERMQIDQLIPVYGNRREAVHAVATLGWRDRVAPIRRHVGVVAVACIALIAAFVITQTTLLADVIGTPETWAYNKTLTQYNEICALCLNRSDPDAHRKWQEMKEETLRKVDPIKERYRGTRGDIGRNRIRNAAFEVVSLAHIEEIPTPDRLEVACVMLRQANKTLEKQCGVELALPRDPLHAGSRVGRSSMIAELTHVPRAQPQQAIVPVSHVEDAPVDVTTHTGEGAVP